MPRFLPLAAWFFSGLAAAASLRAQNAASATAAAATAAVTAPPPAVPASDAALPAAPAKTDTQALGIPLTLDQCVAQALGKNFSVRVQAYSVDQAKAGVIIARSTYDPVLGVAWQKVVNKSPAEEFTVASNSVAASAAAAAAGTGSGTTTSTNPTVTAYFPQTNAQTTTVSATQNIITGGQISANYIVEYATSNSPVQFLNPSYDGTVSLNVTQPLLQGAGSDYGRAAIEIAKAGSRIASLNFKSVVLTAIFNVETAYYNLIFNREQYAVGQDSLKLAQQLLDENRIKRQTGVLTDLDVVQAEAGVALARSQLIGYRQAMQNAEDTLLASLGEREFRAPVGAVDFPPLPDTNVSFYYSYKQARDNGPDLAVVQTTIEQLQFEALRAKRNDLPNLSVNGGAGYLTERDSYLNAASKVWNGPGYNWQGGVTLSFPWGLRQNQALYRQAKDSLSAEQTTFDETDQQLTVQVRAAVRAVEANVESVASASEATRLSEKQYELQKAKFDAGLATSYDVLQAQTQLSTARVSQIQAEVSLRVALADLRFLEGTSLAAYHVNLN
jgi:outer membrane protein TolC